MSSSTGASELTGDVAGDPVAEPVLASRSRRGRSPSAYLIPVVLVAVAAALRLVNVGRSYDLFIDEVDYVNLGVSLRDGHFPPRFENKPFLLHPPLFFVLSALWEEIVGTSRNYFHLVAKVRTLNALLGVVTTLLIYLIVKRLSSRMAAVAAAAIYALDPYILRQNGRVTLETSTLVFFLGGLAVLLLLFEDPNRPESHARHASIVACVGGVLLGLSILGKEMTSILVVLPLVVLYLRRWGIARRITILIFLSACVPYAVYLVIVAAIGQMGNYWFQTTYGLQRIIGIKKVTGFTQAGSPSLVSTLIAQLSGFGVTYLVCGLGILAGLVVLRIGRPDQKFQALVTIAGTLTLMYSVFFGTIEEQFLYFGYIPAICSLAIAGQILLSRRQVGSSRRPAVVVMAVLAIFLAYDLGLWVNTRTTPDNGVQRIVAFFQHDVQNPGDIANDTSATYYGLLYAGFHVTPVGTPALSVRRKIKYVTILSKSVNGNYGLLNKQQASFYEKNGTVVFSFDDPTYGHLRVLKTKDLALW